MEKALCAPQSCAWLHMCSGVCTQDRTCKQLQEILQLQNAHPMLSQLYAGYLLHRLEGRKRGGLAPCSAEVQRQLRVSSFCCREPVCM